MIRPNTREQFTYQDLTFLAGRTRRYTGDPEMIAHTLAINPDLLTETLDEPEVISAVSTDAALDKQHSNRLFFYVTSRQALLSRNIRSVLVADYIAALLTAFSSRGRAWKVDDYDDATYSYVVDLRFDGIHEPQSHRAFKLHAHLGNFALWQAGLYPEHVISRGLTLDYYDTMGSSGFKKAALSPQAALLDLTEVFESVSVDYLSIRGALNTLSDTTGYKDHPCEF